MDKDNHEANLNHISRYLLSLFEFAARSRKKVFEQNEWLDFSGTDGRWLFSLYIKDTLNGRAMRDAVDQLFAMEAKQRDKIYKAIKHDMEFTEDLFNSFTFQSLLLEEEEQKIIEDFFVYFYKIVLCKTSFKLSGLSKSGYGRREFTEEFFQGNQPLKRVCPVCLTTTTNAQKEEDIEHYFAKTFVPCLALHPHNLYFACPACNRIYKHTRNPILNVNTDIRRIFLPYFDTIRDKVKIEFLHEEKEDRIRLMPLDWDEEYIEEKIAAFNQIFHIEERWSSSLEHYYSTNAEQYKSLELRKIQDLQAEIKRDLKKNKAVGSSRPEKYLETRYLEWLSDFQLKAFYANISQDGREVVVLP